MPTSGEVSRLAAVVRDTVVGLVRKNGVDLFDRQLAILLICFLDEGAAPDARLGGSTRRRPAITRCVDRLVKLDLVSRTIASLDRRSLLVGRTTAGADYMTMLRGLVRAAPGEVDATRPPPHRCTSGNG